MDNKLRETRLKEALSVERLVWGLKHQGFKITCTAIYKIEKGNSKPHYNTMKALADFFDVSIDYLFNQKPEGGE